MANPNVIISFDAPRYYAPIVARGSNLMSDVWQQWFSTFIQQLQGYLTNQGIIVPNFTALQIPNIVNPVPGQMIYNSTTNQFEGWNGLNWLPLPG
jgi:hypothetical protein